MSRLFVLLFLVGVASACQTVQDLGLTPNVCEFSGSLNFDAGTTNFNLCVDANEDPFQSSPPGLGVDADTCRNAVQEDGADCETLYSEFQCSSKCMACNKLPCQRLCDEAPSTCPTAVAVGCFGTLQTCTTSTRCTDWNTDLDRVSTSATTTRSTTTRATSTETTSTSSDGETSGASSLRLFLF